MSVCIRSDKVFVHYSLRLDWVQLLAVASLLLRFRPYKYLVWTKYRSTILVMPFIIHAAWIRVEEPGSGSQLFLWAEDPDAVGKAQTSFATATTGVDHNANARSTNVRQRGPKVPSHPGQVSIGQLRALLTSESIQLAVPDLQPANAIVWLPSVDGLPLTRRSVFQTNGSGRGGMIAVAEKPALTKWQVTGLALSPLAALHFLSRLSSTAPRQNGNASWTNATQASASPGMMASSGKSRASGRKSSARISP